MWIIIKYLNKYKAGRK